MRTKILDQGNCGGKDFAMIVQFPVWHNMANAHPGDINIWASHWSAQGRMMYIDVMMRQTAHNPTAVFSCSSKLDLNGRTGLGFP
jgi:hypothetical protein